MNHFNEGLVLGIFIGIVSGFLLGGVIIGGITNKFVLEDLMKEAYDRGHAVQCLGKEGYYWDCKE